MIDRRRFIALTAMAAAGCRTATRAQDSAQRIGLEQATIDDLQTEMASGRITSRSITETYLQRIAMLDQQGPSLHSVIETNPEALSIADALDIERKTKGARGPLHGIPVLLKDNIGTADKMTTTAGSLALSGSIPSRDSAVAQKLRAAGAVVFGKANMSEWANFRSPRSSSGWSARGGQCRNPYVLDRNPCGSSSGSAVATSADLCAVAIGTETDGSIVCPAAANGVVGIKPTVGLISTSGIIPVAHSQDTAGPIARTVTDAAILLGVLTQSTGDYRQYLDLNGLKGARIGVCRDFFGFEPAVDRLMEAAIEMMKMAGAEIVDPANIATMGQFNISEIEVLLYEFKADLNAYLASLENAPVRSLREVIDFNDRNKDKELLYFGQERFLAAEAKGPLTSAAYLQAVDTNRRLARDEGIDALMDRYRLDAIIGPTNGSAWLIDLEHGDHFSGGSSSPAAVAGYPSITVPCGFVGNLPIGISFFGRARSEGTLIRIAFAYEQLGMWRKPPAFLPTE